MSVRSPGLHHVTAIAGDPQRNVDFHRRILGLRLVKRTVNFDDPGTYHLYYGDGGGSPGTLITFFPWSGARAGTPGAGETAGTAYAIPPGTLDWWRARLAAHDVASEPPLVRFGAAVLPFADPDGLRLELVEDAASDPLRIWSGGPVPGSYAIRGFHSVTFAVATLEPTGALLTAGLGFRAAGDERGRRRFVAEAGGPASIVDLVERPGPRARLGAGSVHHVAFRASDDGAQLALRDTIVAGGRPTTEVKDRCYFHSVYFREPGGVLFEIATDPPGMLVDESLDELGEALQLPPWLEERREELERTLPALETPAIAPERA